MIIPIGLTVANAIGGGILLYMGLRGSPKGPDANVPDEQITLTSDVGGLI